MIKRVVRFDCQVSYQRKECGYCGRIYPLALLCLNERVCQLDVPERWYDGRGIAELIEQRDAAGGCLILEAPGQRGRDVQHNAGQ